MSFFMKISTEKHQQRAQGHGGYYWTIKLHLNHAKWFTVLYFALIEIIILWLGVSFLECLPSLPLIQTVLVIGSYAS